MHQGDRPTITLTITEAAEATGRSRDTIKRAVHQGRLPGAAREGGKPGAWRIPVGDLVAAGYTLTRPHQDATPVHAPDATRADVLAAQAEAREYRARWEAAERVIAVQTQMLQMLGAAPQVTPHAPTSAQLVAPVPSTRWWRRFWPRRDQPGQGGDPGTSARGGSLEVAGQH